MSYIQYKNIGLYEIPDGLLNLAKLISKLNENNEYNKDDFRLIDQLLKERPQKIAPPMHNLEVNDKMMDDVKEAVHKDRTTIQLP